MSEMREVIGVQVIKPWRRGDRLEKRSIIAVNSTAHCSQLSSALM